MLDIGAAAGSTTKRMLKSSPNSRVIAFEPFPGNRPFFERTVKGDPRVTFWPMAVSDRPGTVKFLVRRTVQGTEPGWENMKGYSSAGFLLDDEQDPRADASFDVEMCRVDDVISEHVRFMKIDVQGGELNVLKGSRRLLSSGMIDLLLIEFGGTRAVLDLLDEYGYAFFDSAYILFVRRTKPPIADWYCFSERHPSNAGLAFRAWPERAPTEIGAYCRFLRSEGKRIGGVYTDIVAVAPHFIAQFQKATEA